MEAVIFIGIQGAGKSSFYKERFFQSHVRINLDMLKTRNRESVLLYACISAKQPFVVDNTNVAAKDRAKYVLAARAAGFRVTAYYFRADVKSALRRNSERAGASRVPDKAIFGTAKRMEPPRLAEGFDAIYAVSLDALNRFIVEEWADSDGAGLM
ncbi:MAG TPA: AAA family ATPase [Pyrinomonadaceae bacterium]|jgi:predicted kinase